MVGEAENRGAQRVGGPETPQWGAQPRLNGSRGALAAARALSEQLVVSSTQNSNFKF